MESTGKKLLHEEKFDKGISLAVVDRSRQVAGDRWLVKIDCFLSIDAKTVLLWPAENGASEEDRRKAREAGEKILLRTFTRERHFVDLKERLQVRDELLDQLKSTIFPYLRKPSCADRLLAERFLKPQLMHGSESEENPFAHLDKEEGPADFSSLFG